MTDHGALPTGSADVRMRGFAHRWTVAQALAWLDEQVRNVAAETIPLAESHGRVIAVDVASVRDVPGFDRAMMDGFAVRAADVAGAAPYSRLTLEVVGQSLPGRPFPGQVDPGQAIRIMTGAPIPAGADAVLPVERVEVEGTRIHALDEVPPGKHIGHRGEDIAQGQTVLAAPRRLRPQDVGLLASMGLSQVSAVGRVRVRIIATGDELLPVGAELRDHSIIDSNSIMLAGLVTRDGGRVVSCQMVADQPEAVWQAMQGPADVLLVSGGSSVGQEDHAPRLLARHGELAIHGIAMRPSSPAGMGRLGETLVFLLPGNPVSCLCAYDFFAGRAIRMAAGLARDWPYRRRTLPLRRKLVSTVGRVDYARVALVEGGVEPLAISGASILSSTVRADGFVIVPGDSEGYPAGAETEVYLYD